MKLLSEHLARLSNHAKIAEDRVATAQSEVTARLDGKRAQVSEETEQALAKLQQRFNDAKAENRTRLQAVQSKVEGDFQQVRQRAEQAKDKFEAWQADNYAADMEADALDAIDYAIVATKIAELQTLDAIAARARAGGKAEQLQPTTA